MTSFLARVHQQHDELTQASFLERVAAMSGCPTAASFCHDFGLNLTALKKGDQEQLGRLADAVQGDPFRITTNAIREVAPRSYELRGCHVIPAMLRTDEVALCPVCVREDLANATNRFNPFDAVYLRIPWHFRGIETCSMHRCVLSRFPLTATRHDRRSFAVFGWDAAYQIVSPSHEIVSRSPTQFELFIEACLQGKPSGTWLEEIPFSEAVRLCEAVGLRLLGNHSAEGTSGPLDVDAREAREAGYQLLSPSRASISVFLSASLVETRKRWRTVSLRKLLGIYLSTLMSPRHYETTDFAIFRNDVRAFLEAEGLDRAWNSAGVSGRPKSQSCHSYTLQEASSFLNLTPQAIHFFASEINVEPHDLSRQAVSRIRTRSRRLWTMKKVREILDLPYSYIWALSEAGLLGTTHRGSASKANRKFEANSVLILVERLRSVSSQKIDDSSWLSLSEAKNKYRCGIDVVFELLLSNTECRFVYEADSTKFTTIRIHETDFFKRLYRVDEFGVSSRSACKILNISHTGLSGLLKEGFLRAYRIDRGAAKVVYITDASIASFNKLYISAGSLADELGVVKQTMSRDFIKRGIVADIPRSRCGANFYLRCKFGL